VGKKVPGSMGELEKEANVLASIQHPHIITLYDFGEDDEGAFVVMELIEGRTLTQLVQEAPLSETDFVVFAEQVLNALVEAQSQGLLHRDLKPSNLMIANLGSSRIHTKILDFGLAKFSFKPALQTVMVDNSVLGSVYCMAPEQFDRRPLDFRTDLYSLGCSFYFALVGAYPFLGDTMAEVMQSHMDHDTVPLQEKRPGISPSMSEWVMRMIAFDPEDRPQSARECLLDFRDLSGRAPAPELRKPLPLPQLPRGAVVGAPRPAVAPATPPVVPPHLRKGRRRGSGGKLFPLVLGWSLVGLVIVGLMIGGYKWIASRVPEVPSGPPTTVLVSPPGGSPVASEDREIRLEDGEGHGVIRERGKLPVFATGPDRGYHAVYRHERFTARLDADGILFLTLLEDGKPVATDSVIRFLPRLRSRSGFREVLSAEADEDRPVDQPAIIRYSASLRGESVLLQNIAFQGNQISFWGHCSDPLYVDEPTTAYFIDTHVGPTHRIEPGNAPEVTEAVLGQSRLRLRSKSAKSETLVLLSEPVRPDARGLLPHASTSVQAKLNVWEPRMVNWRLTPSNSGDLRVRLKPDSSLYEGFQIVYRKNEPELSTREIRMAVTID
ncbi:MAG: serine/threonine-protein kinase, partial [Verrucomicrobiota bacterium]